MPLHGDWWGPVPWFMLPLLMALVMMVMMGIFLMVSRVHSWMPPAWSNGRKREDRSPADQARETLRLRFARGDITRQQYEEALVELLKERYVRDELDMSEFEDRLSGVLAEPRSHLGDGRLDTRAGPPRGQGKRATAAAAPIARDERAGAPE
jgi:uncharacterized membrane protein